MKYFFFLMCVTLFATACSTASTPPTGTPSIAPTSEAYSGEDDEGLWDAPETTASASPSPSASAVSNSTPAADENFSQTSGPQAGDTVAIIKTNMGDIKIRLFPAFVPKTVENFVTLAKKDYYDGIIFHRVIPDFMIQGGDPTGTGAGGESAWGGKFDDEFNIALSNIKGSISMANAGANTNGSQFFINQNDNTFLDFNKPPLTSGHSVFGQVFEGMDVVNTIATVQTGPGDKPAKDVVIEDVIIEEFK